MSKRNRARRAAAASAPQPVQAPMPGPDLLRRLLLVLLTVLVVARPLVSGEFPGQDSDFSDSGGMTFTFLALVGCAAWSAWRLWSREPAVYVGPVELALFALVALIFVATSSASYFRSAWLTAWEWLGIVLMMFLARQLAARPDERHGLIAVVLATAVALAAEGAVQSLITMPRQAAAASEAKADTTAFIEEQLQERGIQASQLELYQLTKRLEGRLAHGPYFHPSSLAAVLALALPALVGAVVASRRGGGPNWQTALVAACALLVGVVLYLTGDRAALLAVVAAGLGVVGVLFWPARLGSWKVGLPLALLATIALAASGIAAETSSRVREVWPAAWRVVENHFWRGIGPSQFSLHYPRYMAGTAGPKVVQPSSMLLELATTAGVFLVIGLLVVFALFVRSVRRWWLLSETTPAPSEAVPTPEKQDTPAGVRGGVDPPFSPGVRWEYYVGGMIGLVLAFVLRAGVLSVDREIVGEAISAGLRSVVWFAAFGLFEGLAWSAGEYVAALSAGLASFFGLLLFQAGIGYPSVAGPAWIVAALVLATVMPAPPLWLGRQTLINQLPLPIFIAAAFAYFIFVFYPAANSDRVIRRARERGAIFDREKGKPPEAGRTLEDPASFLAQGIVLPLEQARKEDPDNVQLLVLLARRTGELWSLSPLGNRQPSLAEVAIRYAGRAQRVNPLGQAGYLAEWKVRLQIADTLNRLADQVEKEKGKGKDKQPIGTAEQRRQLVTRLRNDVRQQYEIAAEVLQKCLLRDPTDPALHAERALLLEKVGSEREAQKEAAEALRLDERVGNPRKLTNAQRKQLEEGPGKEFLR